MIKVLIADDEAIIRRTIRRIGNWEEYQMEVTEAQNGLEAVSRMMSDKPDILLLDMKMPGRSGAEILQLIAEERMDIMVVVISGYDDFQYARTALKYGAADYILKPIDRNELNQTLLKLSQVLRKNQAAVGMVLPKPDVINEIRERIDKHYAAEISVTSLASEYYFNRDVLSRTFKKRYGIGVTGYINQVRLEQAKAYLLSGYNSTQTAALVGYHDVNYFSRVFKKHYGISPTGFAREAEEEK